MIMRAVRSDLEEKRMLSVQEHWMLPTPELRQQMLEAPIAGINQEEIRGRDSICWLGAQAANQMAVDQGLTDFREWLKENDWQSSPKYGNRIHPYVRIHNGISVVRAIETDRRVPAPTWQEVMDEFGADDPVVQKFFARVQEHVRVDAATLFNYLTGFIRMGMIFSDDPKQEAITQQLDSFLLDRGYIPDGSKVAVIELKKPSIPDAE